jgi:Bacteriophage tail sheath protein
MPVQTSFPGVYIQELPSGVHSIVGVSTSVTAFVGAARRGPIDAPQRIFNYADFVRIFGDPIGQDHPMGYAVQQFFANGGSEAVVVRAASASAKAATVALQDAEASPKTVLQLTALGKGSWANYSDGSAPLGVDVDVDRSATTNPDDLFDLVVTRNELDPRTSKSVVAEQETYTNLSMSPSHPRYALNLLGGSNIVQPTVPSLTSAKKGSSVGKAAITDPLTIKAGNNTLRVSVDFGPPVDLVLFPADTAGNGSVQKSAANIKDEINKQLTAAGLAAAASQSSGTFTIESSNPSLNSAITVIPAPENDISKDLKLGRTWGGTEISGAADFRPAAKATQGLGGGDEGADVTPSDVVPASEVGGLYALSALRFPRFNLLCLPDLHAGNELELGNALAYCKQERAFLIVDSPPAGWDPLPPTFTTLTAIGEHGAVYYPRGQLVENLTGGTSRTLNLPLCGAIAGVMARTDTARGIWKAPAGLQDGGIVGISDLTVPTDDTTSGQLNPHGINVVRKFPGAGIVVWGARTLKGADDSATSDFKYISVRRLTDYIASSLYIGTQFAVFEPNGPDLWGQLRLAVTTFMRGLFRQGAFQQSTKRDEAYSFFVTCDDSVNPQSDIDLGRVNVVVGFAPLKPAEFVVISITQISHLEG